MLRTKENRKLKGMTLIEVIIGMTVIVLVTIIAYMGVSTSANFLQKGTDLRNSDGPAVSQIEAARAQYYANGAAETTVVNFDVKIIGKVTDAAGETVETSVVTNYSKSEPAGIVKSVAGDVEYDMYVPYVVTTVPAVNP